MNTNSSTLRIRITETTKSELADALATVQPTGRAKGDINVDALLALVVRAENALDKLGIARRARTGAQFTFAYGGASANAYRSAIPTTRVTLARDARGWLLVAVDRIPQFPKAREIRDVRLTDAQSWSLTNPKLRGYVTFIDKESPFRLERSPAADPAVQSVDALAA